MRKIAVDYLESLFCALHTGGIKIGILRRRIKSFVSQIFEFFDSCGQQRNIKRAVIPVFDISFCNTVPDEVNNRFHCVPFLSLFKYFTISYGKFPAIMRLLIGKLKQKLYN